MKLVWGNSFDGTTNYKTYERRLSEKDATGNAVQSTLNNPYTKKNSLTAQKMEAKLREAEEKLLEEYRQQLIQIENSGDDNKTKEVKMAGINEKIKQIEDARALREQEAFKLELEKQKAEAEKQKNASEKNRDETASEEDRETGLKREDIEGMVKISVSIESLRELKRTKASMKSEAKQLEIDIDNDFGIGKYGQFKSGHLTPNDFKHKQLNKLNKGVITLESSIASEVGKMAKTAADIIKEKTDTAKVSDIPKEKVDTSIATEDKLEDDKEANDESVESKENSVDISL